MAKSKVPKSGINFRKVSSSSAALDGFKLADLQQFSTSGGWPGSNDLHLFFVGKDNIHELLLYLLSHCRQSLYLNMFGYDDPELNDVIMQKIQDPAITCMITLDRQQSTTPTETAILAADAKTKGGLNALNTDFVIGSSSSGQISHTKGFVVDGFVGAEGSTNWSASGQGTGTPGTPGYKAQNNTQTVFLDPSSVTRFQAELIEEHKDARRVPGTVTSYVETTAANQAAKAAAKSSAKKAAAKKV
jgi:hypothetical protein